MIGRPVRTQDGQQGVVVQWEPLSSGMCDVLVELTSGSRIWYASHTLRPLDGRPLPDRKGTIKRIEAQTLTQLQSIREQWLHDPRPWPGNQILNRAIESAIADVKRGRS